VKHSTITCVRSFDATRRGIPPRKLPRVHPLRASRLTALTTDARQHVEYLQKRFNLSGRPETLFQEIGLSGTYRLGDIVGCSHNSMGLPTSFHCLGLGAGNIRQHWKGTIGDIYLQHAQQLFDRTALVRAIALKAADITRLGGTCAEHARPQPDCLNACVFHLRLGDVFGAGYSDASAEEEWQGHGSGSGKIPSVAYYEKALRNLPASITRAIIIADPNASINPKHPYGRGGSSKSRRYLRLITHWLQNKGLQVHISRPAVPNLRGAAVDCDLIYMAKSRCFVPAPRSGYSWLAANAVLARGGMLLRGNA